MFLNHVFRQEWFNRFPWFVVSLIKNGRTLRKCYICFLVGIKTFEILAYIIGVAGNSRYQWLNLQLFVTSAGWRPRDKGGGGGGGGSPKNFFSSLLASVWSKNKAAGPSPGFATGHICVFNTGGFVLDCHALCLQDFISNRIYWSTNWNSLFIFVDVFLFFILTSSLMFPLRHRFARCSFFASYCLWLRKIPWNASIIT